MLSKGFPPPAKLALAQEHMPPLQGGGGGWLSVIRPKCALPVHSILIHQHHPPPPHHHHHHHYHASTIVVRLPEGAGVQ